MKLSRYDAAGLKCIEVAPDDAASRDLPLVVMMHGRGDWGESYVDIAPAISQRDYRFVFPTGPLPLPGALYEWFRFDQQSIAAGAAKVRVQISAMLDEVRQKYQTPAARTFLSGFSQGGMMTLDTGLRYPEKLAGLLCLSGFLIADAPFNWSMPSPQAYYGNDRGDLQATLTAATALQIPTFLAHGSYDPVVPIQAGRATREVLQKAGLPVEYYEFPGQHEITLDELGEVKDFLKRQLA